MEKHIDSYDTWINLAVEKRVEELYTEDTDSSYDKAVIQTCQELKQWKKTFWNDSWKPKYERSTERQKHKPSYPVVRLVSHRGITKSLMKVLLKNRPWLQRIWNDKADIHDENAMFAISNELKCDGATDEDIHCFCKIMLGKEYDPKETTKRWKYINGKPHRMETLKKKLPIHLQGYL